MFDYLFEDDMFLRKEGLYQVFFSRRSSKSD